MPQIQFISDLHLHPDNPHITRTFLHFLKTLAPQAEALYILGDFFEAWIGDDDKSELIALVKDHLKELRNKGVAIYLLPGNRDFLMGETFAQEAGCQLLQDPICIHLYGKQTVLTHGDLLCKADRSHQYFRRFTAQSWVKQLFLALPLSWRRFIAAKIRQASQNRTQTLNKAVMDVTPTAVNEVLESFRANQLIHGHTHHPAIHGLVDGKKRVVLGAWDSRGSVLICPHQGDPELVTFSA